VAGILSHAPENTQLNGYSFSFGDAVVLRALVNCWYHIIRCTFGVIVSFSYFRYNSRNMASI